MKYDNANNLRTVLKSARIHAGITQEELARRLSTKQPCIARAEKQGVKTIYFAEKWVEACGYYLRFNHISFGDGTFSESSFTEEI